MAPRTRKRRTSHAVRAFFLHVYHREHQGKTTIYAIGRLETGETFGLVDDRDRPCLFVRASDRDRVAGHTSSAPVTVEPCDWTTMDGEPVQRVSANTVSVVRKFADLLAKDHIRTYEADVSPARQYLINRGLRRNARISGPHRPGTGVDRVYIYPELEPTEWEPELAVLALDIETNRSATETFAVSLVGTGPTRTHTTEQIHIVGKPSPKDPENLTCHPTEAELLTALAARIREIDPDVLTGWNVVDFDLPVLRRCFEAHGLEFNLGRTRSESWYREGQSWGRSGIVVYGRQVMDALHLVRATLQRYEDYRLDTVAKAILGRGKTLEAADGEGMPEAIARAYREDRPAFCEYCLEDSRLVRDILKSEGLIELSLRRSLLTGLPLDRAWASVAAFEFLYITALHKRRIVAPTAGVDQPEQVGAPGGLVMAAKGGLHHNVLVFDFKSLYPSIIRTFNIDPLAHVKARQAKGEADVIHAPNGATFDREPGILPALLEGFFARRDEAKAEGNDLASYAYKIVMNSFYGVLGTPSCRFASDKLAGAVTQFGHHVLLWTRKQLEEKAHRVLYGDTDSLFVDAGLGNRRSVKTIHAEGMKLCSWINKALARYVKKEFGVASRLELEFEKAYKRFLLPSMRGAADRARAKGYAGLRVDEKGETLEIIGMEAVRRDWTELAHALQRDLLDRLFHDESPASLERCITQWIRDLRAGNKDKDLVYHKALRKAISGYTRTTPPHVKAAKLLPRPSGVIHYVMTTAGPQPLGHVSDPIDYGHYIQKQIEPIVRTIAQVCPIDVNAAIKGERSLFSQT